MFPRRPMLCAMGPGGGEGGESTPIEAPLCGGCLASTRTNEGESCCALFRATSSLELLSIFLSIVLFV